MADNNPGKRASLARCAAGIFIWEFTSTFDIGGASVAACIGEMSDAEQLMIAGMEKHRAELLTVLASALVGVQWKPGDAVTLDGDPNWQIASSKLSPDGAVYTFILIDGQ